MLKHRIGRFSVVAVVAFSLLLALSALFSGPTSTAMAKLDGGNDRQQMGTGQRVMTNTMPMNMAAMEPMMGQMMGQMMGMMAQMQTMMDAGMRSNMPMTGTMSITGTMPMEMGQQMQRMGHMMNMMGQMMQMQSMMTPSMMGNMTGTMPMGMMDDMGMMDMGMMDMGMMRGMMAQMHKQMGGHMGIMGSTMPMTGTMAMMGNMTGTMPMGMMGNMTGTMPMDMMGMHQMMNFHRMHRMMHMVDHMPGMMELCMGMMGQMTNTMPMTGTPSADQSEAAATAADQTQTAELGAITFKVTPLNLEDAKAETLDFNIVLDTHTVDLNFDLAELVTLQIGDQEVAASAWETAGSGNSNHHVEGTLRFATTDADGNALREAATEVSVVFRGLPGDSEHVFVWRLSETS